MSLVSHLKGIKDYRTGPVDYPLWVILLIVVMAIMSGRTGYSAMETFAKRHQTELWAYLELPDQPMPSDTTFRRVLLHVRWESLMQVFNAWMQERCPDHQGHQFASDGKSIKASVKNYDQSHQDFVSLVSLFNVQLGVVLGLAAMQNGAQSEIITFRQLLGLVQIEGACFSLDALHTQKPTIETIIESNNDYLVAAKGNQPTLQQALQDWAEQSPPNSVKTHTTKGHGRTVTRTVSVFDAPPQIAATWPSVQSCIRVERSGTRDHKPFSETIFYISSLQESATQFAHRIRHHWHIENRLHWVKDVVLKEDDTPLCGGTVAITMGILRTVAVNLFRLNHFDSITQGIHNLAHDIKTLFSFFQ
jgi:predicted transposase YbfD/YdcC